MPAPPIKQNPLGGELKIISMNSHLELRSMVSNISRFMDVKNDFATTTKHGTLAAFFPSGLRPILANSTSDDIFERPLKALVSHLVEKENPSLSGIIEYLGSLNQLETEWEHGLGPNVTATDIAMLCLQKSLVDSSYIYTYAIYENFLRNYFGTCCFRGIKSDVPFIFSAAKIASSFNDFRLRVKKEYKNINPGRQALPGHFFFESLPAFQSLHAAEAAIRATYKEQRNNLVHENNFIQLLSAYNASNASDSILAFIRQVARFIDDSNKISGVNISDFKSYLEKILPYGP